MIVRPLNPGDVVRLRSGGPWMTVEATDGTRVRVVYFNPTNTALGEPPDEFENKVYEATLLEVTLIDQRDCA